MLLMTMVDPVETDPISSSIISIILHSTRAMKRRPLSGRLPWVIVPSRPPVLLVGDMVVVAPQMSPRGAGRWCVPQPGRWRSIDG